MSKRFVVLTTNGDLIAADFVPNDARTHGYPVVNGQAIHINIDYVIGPGQLIWEMQDGTYIPVMIWDNGFIIFEHKDGANYGKGGEADGNLCRRNG